MIRHIFKGTKAAVIFSTASVRRTNLKIKRSQRALSLSLHRDLEFAQISAIASRRRDYSRERAIRPPTNSTANRHRKLRGRRLASRLFEEFQPRRERDRERERVIFYVYCTARTHVHYYTRLINNSSRRCCAIVEGTLRRQTLLFGFTCNPLCRKWKLELSTNEFSEALDRADSVM